MQDLVHNIRFYILALSIVFSLVINASVLITVPDPTLQTIRLTQTYGLTAFVFLYLTLLSGPFCASFPSFIWKRHFLKARRGFGVAAFYFASLHATIAFFGQLGGLAGLGFLTANYQIAIASSATALFILMLLAVTSFDDVIEKMTIRRWKVLHRFVYIAGVLILVHIVMLGTHFQDLTSPVARVTFLAMAFLFFLQALRVDSWLQKRFGWQQKFSYASLLVCGLVISGVLFLFSPMAKESAVLLSVHQQHPQTTQQQNINTQSKQMLASMQGDPSLRYTVSFAKPNAIVPNQDSTLSFSVFNATTGSENKLFQKLYEKEAHLILVDNQLEYFAHVHPQKVGNSFTINTRFPHPGGYRAYLTYQPVGAVEQQVGFSFPVGQMGRVIDNNDEQLITTKGEKTFGKYKITIDTQNGLNVKEMANATDTLTFVLRDSATDQPVINLKPYLGAFGHLVMIHTKDYSYMHVHPTGLDPQMNQSGGPEVTFAPMPLTDPIRPGVYKVFAEFNPNGEIVVADFMVEVKE